MQSIQLLVASIRAEEAIPVVRSQLSHITGLVSNAISATESSWTRPSSYSSALKESTQSVTAGLLESKQKLLAASADSDALDHAGKTAVKEFTQRLPPLAFEIARQIKELGQRIEDITSSGEAAIAGLLDDFS